MSCLTRTEITFQIILVIFAAVIVFSSFKYWLYLPVVQISWSTGECVSVIPEVKGSCSELPEKYSLEWVK